MSIYPKIHLSFAVRDLERSAAFYTKFFGEEPVKAKPGYVKFLPSIAPLNLALHTRRTPGGKEMHHMGIEVEDHETVMEHLRRIRESGLKTREEMDVNCCHANQDKFWVEDPDGREWEIYVFNRDIDDHAHHGGDGCCEDLEQALELAEANSSGVQACCS